MSARTVLLLLFAGGCWGVLAWLLGHKAFGEELFGGVLMSPLIGLGIGRLTQGRFENVRGVSRVGISLATLGLAATLFGLVLGVTAWLFLGLPPGVAIAERVVATWYGVFGTGFVLALWPLAYLTHRLLEASDA